MQDTLRQVDQNERQNDYRHGDTAKSDGASGKTLFDATSNRVPVNSSWHCFCLTTPAEQVQMFFVAEILRSRWRKGGVTDRAMENLSNRNNQMCFSVHSSSDTLVISIWLGFKKLYTMRTSTSSNSFSQKPTSPSRKFMNIAETDSSALCPAALPLPRWCRKFKFPDEGGSISAQNFTFTQPFFELFTPRWHSENADKNFVAPECRLSDCFSL